MLHDPLNDAMAMIKNAEQKGKRECVINPSSKLIGHVLKVMQEAGYIAQFEYADDGKAGTFKVKLAGKTKLQPGQDMAIPFSVAIPSPRPVSGPTRNSTITWRLRGVLARFMRGDTLVEEEIFVHSGRPA